MGYLLFGSAPIVLVLVLVLVVGSSPDPDRRRGRGRWEQPSITALRASRIKSALAALQSSLRAQEPAAGGANCGLARTPGQEGGDPTAIDPEFLAMLACPGCRSELELRDDDRLVCASCRRAYPIRDGFPVLLVDEAVV